MGPWWGQGGGCGPASRDICQCCNWQCSPAEGQPCSPLPNGCISPSPSSCAFLFFSATQYTHPFNPPEGLPLLLLLASLLLVRPCGKSLVQPDGLLCPQGEKGTPPFLCLLRSSCATSRVASDISGLCWNSPASCGRPASPDLLGLSVSSLGQPFPTSGPPSVPRRGVEPWTRRFPLSSSISYMQFGLQDYDS